MIRLSVPGSLEHREVVLRVVESSCKLVRLRKLQELGQEAVLAQEQFETEVVSALGEAFNNVAIHGYGSGNQAGEVVLEIEATADAIVIRLKDYGTGFDPSVVPAPDLGQLPESGMGMFIISSFMDSVVYERGSPPDSPNVLCLIKRRPS